MRSARSGRILPWPERGLHSGAWLAYLTVHFDSLLCSLKTRVLYRSFVQLNHFVKLLVLSAFLTSLKYGGHEGKEEARTT